MEQLPPRNILLTIHLSKQTHVPNLNRNFKDLNPCVFILVRVAILLSDLSIMCIQRFNMKIKMQNMVIVHHGPLPKAIIVHS